MSYTYVTGDGWSVLLPAEPDGATEAVAILDNAIRQIKAFINDETNGVGKLLGSTGQIKTLVIGTSLPTASAVERYWFYSTSLNGLYFCSSGAFIPVFPTGGAVAGKVLKSAGLGVLPTWGSSKPLRAVVVNANIPTFTAGVATYSLALESAGNAAVAISSGSIVLTAGYSHFIRGLASSWRSNGTVANLTYQLYNTTTSSVLQYGAVGGYDAVQGNSYDKLGCFDVDITSGVTTTLNLVALLPSGAVQVPTHSSTYPSVRLSVESYLS